MIKVLMKVLDRLEEIIVGTLIAAATIVIFFSVLHRYASGWAIPVVQDWLLSLHFGWAQEICIYMFIWMAKFGAAYGVRTGIHVGVDVFINSLQPKIRAKFVVHRPARRRALYRDHRHPGEQVRLGGGAALRICHASSVSTGPISPKGRSPRTWSGRCGSSTRRSPWAPT